MAVTLLSHALWSLAEVKAYLSHINDATHDDLLNHLINSFTDRFEKQTGRPLGTRDHETTGEVYNGNGERELFVWAFPVVTAVASITVTIIDATGTAESTIDTTDSAEFRLRADNGTLRLMRRVFTAGFQNVTVKYKGGYEAVGDTPDTDTLPQDLHLAGLREIARIFSARERVGEGVKSRSLEGQTTTYDTADKLLPDTVAVLNQYTSWPVP